MEEKKGPTSGAHESSTDMKPGTSNPRILGKLRSGRDNNRPTEDDIAELRAAYMPDVAWAVSGHPPN